MGASAWPARGTEMIDPSVDLKRLLKGREKALWAVRISEVTLAKSRRHSIRGTCFFVCLLTVVLIYSVYQNQGPLFRGEHIEPVPPNVFVILFLLYGAGIIWLIWYSLRSLKTDLAEKKPSIYLITTNRLVATDANYTPITSMKIAEIEHVFTTGSKNKELFVNRKNDTDLDDTFYITDVPNLNDVKSIIDKLIPKGQPK